MKVEQYTFSLLLIASLETQTQAQIRIELALALHVLQAYTHIDYRWTHSVFQMSMKKTDQNLFPLDLEVFRISRMKFRFIALHYDFDDNFSCRRITVVK